MSALTLTALQAGLEPEPQPEPQPEPEPEPELEPEQHLDSNSDSDELETAWPAHQYSAVKQPAKRSVEPRQRCQTPTRARCTACRPALRLRKMAVSVRYVAAWATALSVIMVGIRPGATAGRHAHSRMRRAVLLLSRSRCPLATPWRRSQPAAAEPKPPPALSAIPGDRAALRIPARPGSADTIHRFRRSVRRLFGLPAAAQREGEIRQRKTETVD
jgi:hypothetical protein